MQELETRIAAIEEETRALDEFVKGVVEASAGVMEKSFAPLQKEVQKGLRKIEGMGGSTEEAIDRIERLQGRIVWLTVGVVGALVASVVAALASLGIVRLGG